MDTETLKTTAIVLKKTPYKESSLITSVYTPDTGRIDLLVKGELKISKKKNPIIDLFREIAIEYKEKETGLISPVAIDLIEQFDNIAFYPGKFTEICNISIFLLKNSYSNVKCNLTYSALKNIIKTYSAGNYFFYAESFMKLTYLYEHGLLPEYIIDRQDKKTNNANFIKHLIRYTIGRTDKLPEIDNSYWLNFNKWILNTCRYHNLIVS